MWSAGFRAVLIGVAAMSGLVGSSRSAGAGPVYFVVSEANGNVVHGDSYVLPLTRDADIAHARDLIARGPEAAGASIVVAKIAAGSDGINRNVTAPGEPLWSWHVTEFESFADMAVEVLDGWPTFIEQDVAGWIANTNGSVGLWTYTVTRELGSDPIVVPLPAPWAGGLAMLATGAAVVLRTSYHSGRRS